MADLFYYDTGYIDEKYFGYVADASVQLGSYFEDGYIESSYYQEFGITSSLTCDATKTSGQTVEAYGDWSASFTQSVTALRTAPTSASFTVTVSQSSTAQRTVGMSATFNAVWTSSLTAIAYKNHDAHLASTFTISVNAVANKSANILLEHIADLNAMAARTAALSSALTITSTQTTSATKSTNNSATLAVSATLSADALNIQYASASLATTSSIFTSRYLGTGRPRDLTGPGLSEALNSTAKFGSNSLQGSLTSYPNAHPGTTPKSGQDWIIETWVRPTASTISSTQFINSGGTMWFTLQANSSRQLRITLKSPGSTIWTSTYSSAISANAWHHFAIVKNFSLVSIYIDGTRIETLSASSGWDTYYQTQYITVRGDTTLLVDEVSLHTGTTLGYNPSSTTITVPTTARINDPATTQFLYHFEGNYSDDIWQIADVSASLSTSATLSAQANANTKQGQAGLSTTVGFTVNETLFKNFSSQLSSSVSLSTNAGKLKGIASDLTAAFSQSINGYRIRYFDAAEYSLASTSITARANKVGDITLSSNFALSAVISSYTDASADLNSAFSQTATAYANQLASADLSASASLTSNSGKLKSASASISGVLSFSVTIKSLEGTGIALSSSSTLTVSGQRLRFGQANPTASFTQTTDARANLAIWDIADYEVFCSGFVFDSETKFTSNTPGSGQSLINVTIPRDTHIPSALGDVGGIYLVNGGGADTIFAPIFYLKRVGTDSYDVYQSEIQHAYSQPSDTDNLSTGTWRSTSLSTGNISQSTGAFTKSLYYDGVKGTTTAGTKISGPHSLRILGNPNYVMLMSKWYLTPPTDSTTLRNVSFTPTGTIYSIPYPTVTGADLNELGSSLTASALLVIFFDAVVSSTTSQTATAVKTSRVTAAITSTATLSSTAGFRASANSALATTASISAALSRQRVASATLTITASLNCSASRTRGLASNQSSAFTQSTQAVKKTGNIINASASFTQSTTGIRVRYDSATLSGLASELTVAVKNARGTVLLETTSTLTASPVKNGDLPARLTATFSQSTELRKIVGFSAGLSSAFTETANVYKVKALGSQMSSTFTLTANTLRSKTTRFISTQSATSTLTASVRRYRETISLEAGGFTLTCNNQVLRLAQAHLSDSFSILASPTFIVRITAEFVAFNSTLIVGDVINIDPFYTIIIEPETRGFYILPESRIIAIEQENRVNII